MSIEINIPPDLQPLAGDVKMIEVGGSTVAECLGALVKRYPQLKPRLFTRKGALPKGLNIFINKEAAYPGELARPVHNGDKLYISYIVMGG